jgi:DNA primase
VASPLDWDELEGIDSSGRYTIHNIFRRLSHRDDPWEEYASLRQGIDTEKLKNLS